MIPCPKFIPASVSQAENRLSKSEDAGSIPATRFKYKKSGLLPSPPVRLLTAKEANAQLDEWHYLGGVRGILFTVGHDEGCCVFTNCRSRMLEFHSRERLVELARMVGMPGHKWSMTSLMSKAVKECRKRGYTRIVTYADPWNGNTGTVYLAAGWVRDGETSADTVYMLDGKRISRRTMYNRHGTQSKAAMAGLYGNRLKFEPAPPKPRFVKNV